MSEATTAAKTMEDTTSPQAPAWDVEVFYDGACPLCAKEIRMLRRWDAKRQRIQFTDIATSEFSAEEYGKTQQEFMAEIQGRLPDGRWITGVEVFRRLYRAVGFGWIVWATRMPVISHILDIAYRRFAKNRLKLTGRCEDGSCAL